MWLRRRRDREQDLVFGFERGSFCNFDEKEGQQWWLSCVWIVEMKCCPKRAIYITNTTQPSLSTFFLCVVIRRRILRFLKQVFISLWIVISLRSRFSLFNYFLYLLDCICSCAFSDLNFDCFKCICLLWFSCIC